MTKIQWLSLAAAGAMAVAVASPALAALDRDSAQFLQTAIKGDNSEVMLGRMALQNPTASPGVKRYAQMLINDHGQHRQMLAGIAQQNGLKPERGPSAAADAESVKLHLLKGRSFDTEFVQYMVNDHQKDIGDFRREASLHAGPVSRMAAQTLPTLRKHLDAALDLQRR